MPDIDTIIVGGGIVGVAVARSLALRDHSVIILEREPALGFHATSRNSEVIHGGIYYPRGSNKAHSCVRGKQQLYAYCAARGIQHQRLGKLIVATSPEQIVVLEQLHAQARANGVSDLELLDAHQVKRLEPELRCIAALLSPSTGIVDSHVLLRSLWVDAKKHGADVVFRTSFDGAEVARDGIVVDAAGTRVTCRHLVNAAGFDAPIVAGKIAGFPDSLIPPRYLCKGSYFSISGPSPFSRLIYPIPSSASLGIHITLDLTGAARAGPDQEWVERVDYCVDERKAREFAEAIADYYPGIHERDLVPAYAGIRSKICGPDDPAEDFRIVTPEQSGVAGVVQLFGIESPGLTASLDIADAVTRSLASD